MSSPDVKRNGDAAMSSSRILEEALGAGEYLDDDAPRQQQERVDLPTPLPSPSGGLKPMIERKRKEMLELENKLLNHEQDGAYSRKGDDGRSYFDYVAMQKDNVRLQQMKREYDELRERDREFANRSASQAQRAQSIARRYIDRELPKVPERARKLTVQTFVEIFKRMDWSKAEYADQNAVQAVVEQIFDTSFGRAIRSSQAPADAPSAPAGYDMDDDPPPQKGPQDDEDDFTNNLLFAYDRRRRGSMTVAEAKRAAAAANAKKTEGSAQ